MDAPNDTFLRWLLYSAVLSGLPFASTAQTNYENYTFATFAGPRESPGYYDGNGITSRFNSPFGVAVDKAGNVYAADYGNQTIRKIAPGGVVMTLAGSAGNAGSADGTGYSARFSSPAGVALGTTGNLYVADSANHTIRKIRADGMVTTLAGSPTLSGTNDGDGAAARFSTPRGVAVDAFENVYIADYGNSALRKITPAGVVTTLAGSPTQPGTNNGTGATARFYGPNTLALGTNGNFYVADTGNHTIRMATPAGVVTTLAGLAQVPGTNNGTGNAARFYSPFGVTADTNGNVFVADTWNHAIRKVTPAGMVTTWAGNPGFSGDADGTGSAARFNYLTGVAADGGGNIYVADYSNQLIRKTTSAGSVTTYAGATGGSGAVDGTANAARFNYPSGVTVDRSNNVYVADHANHTIRKITQAGVVATLAGLAGSAGSNNGSGSAARFNTPTGVTVDTNANVYVADSSNHTIRKVTPAGVVSTSTGLAGVSGTNDGTLATARFNNPFAVAVGPGNTIFVADTWNHTIRKITSGGTVTTLAGSPSLSGTNDGSGNAARFYFPEGIAADSAGNLYVADDGNHTIRKVTAAGVVTTLAGAPGIPGFADGPGINARFRFPFGVGVDGVGNVFVADYNNSLIRKITPAGMVTTLAGTPGKSGTTDGSGATARFNCPEGLAVIQDGTVYLTDACSHTIRRGYLAPTDQPVVDLPLDNPGVTRHMDVTNLTTASWSWSIVRYPSPAQAQLSAATSRNPTLTPDLADLYTIRFQGTDSQGRLAIGTVDIIGSGLIEPQISSIRMSGGNLVLTGSGGAPGASYSMLVSPSLSLPLGAWTPLPGNKFDNNGNFAFTNGPSGPLRAYRLRVP